MSEKNNILVIEDNNFVLEVLIESLSKDLNVNVEGASTIESAIFYLRKDYFNLIITDWYLDHELSTDLLIRIREGEFDSDKNHLKTSKTPIVIYSGSPIVRNYVNSRKEMLQNVFVIKNLSITNTIDFVKELLSNKTQNSTF
jgi:DNA-binding NtrC family response regulator